MGDQVIPLVRIWAPGRPRTKGHLQVVNKGGNGRKAVLRETNRQSELWRRNVAEQARNALSGRPPWDGGVVVRHTVHFVDSSGDPTAFELGDVDTLERNIGDALKDAGVYSDDSKIICWVSDKICHRYDNVASLALQGSAITVWPAPYFTHEGVVAPAEMFSNLLTRAVEDAMLEVGNLSGVWYGD